MSGTANSLRNGQVVAALDIGSSKTACVIAEIDGSAEAPFVLGNTRVIGIGYHRSNGIKGGAVMDAGAAELSIRSAVDKAERQAGLSIDQLCIALNAGRLRSVNYGSSLEIGGRVKSSNVDALLKQGWTHVAESPNAILHALPIGFMLDKVAGIDDPVGQQGDNLYANFHAVVADMEPVRRILGCIEDSFLTPVSVVAAPYASALATARPTEAGDGVAVIDLGSGTSSVAVLKNGRFIYTDSISKGGHQISAALARRFSIPWREAELLKLHIGREEPIGKSYPQAQETVTRQLATIFVHLRQRMVESGFAFKAVKVVVLSGGGAIYHDAPRIAAEIFGKPTRRGTPAPVSGMPPQLANPAFAALLGVLSYQGRQHLELAYSHGGHTPFSGSLERFGHWLSLFAEQ